jgi:cell division protein FtsW (lipid II flippase)
MMKSRPSSHFLILLLAVVLAAVAHYSIYYGALIRGFETSPLVAYRNIGLLFLLALLPIPIAKLMRFRGNWTLYTSAVILFSVGLTVQYRLFTDPEYVLKDRKAEARQLKTQTLQMHHVQQTYSPEKKEMVGLPATVPRPVDLSAQKIRESTETAEQVLTSGRTLIPVFAILCFIGAIAAMKRDPVIAFLQRNGFLVVLLTLVPLLLAAVTSSAGKSLGNMTPWEPSKIPFLVGFSALLSVLYRNLAKTYWGVPRAKDAVPLVFMAALPFVPFFVLKDFGQMMVFSAVYATLFLLAVRRLPQRVVLVGSVLLVVVVLVVGALPLKTQEKVPLLPAVATPVKAILPDRIQQRFHLWLDGFNPPPPETGWWNDDYESYYRQLVRRNPELESLLAANPAQRERINVDAWFDVLAFQPAQATFGLNSGGVGGRGLGLGFVELIPVADSDYIYAALGEELGLLGGMLVTFALIVLVSAGVRTAIDSRDMFSKLCTAGLTAFLGFQALVNIGGITRALPMTGITLPFVSHGGFSLITSFVMLGMLMAFSHRNHVDREIDRGAGEAAR